MTTYETYDRGLPCKNTACKSHGKPHPNCRCYPGLAEGGEVEHYCASDKPHRLGCKYFKDGGEVHELDVPQHANANYSMVSHLIHAGLHGLLKRDPEGAAEAIDKHNRSVSRGHKLLGDKIKAVFSGERHKDEDHSKAHETIDKWIASGGVNNEIQNELSAPAQENFAAGGEVERHEGIIHKNHLSTIYPEQNMMLQQVRGRASNYLNSLRPQPFAPKLAFDSPPDDREQKKKYHEALKIAANPLSVVEEVQKGTIKPDHVEHFKSMYPEVNDVLQHKLVTKISEMQLEKKKPPFHIRQGLSLLMGAPLSGELSPQNIVAAQAVFQDKRQTQDQQVPAKKSAAIGKSNQRYLLPSQASAERQQKQ